MTGPDAKPVTIRRGSHGCYHAHHPTLGVKVDRWGQPACYNSLDYAANAVRLSHPTDYAAQHPRTRHNLHPPKEHDNGRLVVSTGHLAPIIPGSVYAWRP